MAELHFNAEEVEPANFDPLPEGKYQAVISASEMKPTKERSGSYLELAFTVIEGAYNGRKVWARLNLQNPSATAVQIARQQLSALCRAVGILNITDSSQLHNLPLQIYVVLKSRGDGNGLTNEIKAYEAIVKTGTVATAPAAVTPTVQVTGAGQPVAATPSPAPWA